MTASTNRAATGAAMDTIMPRRRNKPVVLIAVAVLVLMAGGYLAWSWLPHGLQVPASEVRIATVEKGLFIDDVTVRAKAEPLSSVLLDSVEMGRVEEVLATDGALVTKDQLLFRLSNPQRNLDLLARQTEIAQQISNLSILRVGDEASRIDHQRRIADLQFTLTQRQKQHARDVKLASQGFISAAQLEESDDSLAQQSHLLEQEKASNDAEFKVRSTALAQLDGAIRGLNRGLALVNATVEALAVRAPVAGRLTGFRLQVGETVKTDQHIGRIDHPTLFKLSAQLDEFYLNRVAIGRHGGISQAGKNYPVDISAIYPQIKDGRFTVEMVFTRGQPEGMSPGQSLDAQITLGEPGKATLLPNGAFVNDSGGSWVFVVGRDGRSVERRVIKTGRRSNGQLEILSGLAAGEKVIVSSYASFGKAERLQLSQ
ncbi:efflux RND transporter periplasmic adaptor subunit [Duganella rhizosphaerae]|uniref:efflux RND transporter periplasmic adaptor subunit n=1 Tax=Duganella rhizosphaerae TaxID=2885763 RepID=UPI00403F5E27